jgi:RNA polymerase sigma-70 factor (ECF subfamily)
MALSQEEIVRTLLATRSRVSATVWLVVRDSQAAEDIFQDVSVKAITKGGVFETRGELLSWAFVTARHAAIDWLRRRRPEWTALGDDVLDLLVDRATEQPSPDGPWLDALRACLAGVPSGSRELLQLRYVEGRSCGHVAESLGMTLDAVYQRLSRLHRALKDCVERRLVSSSPCLRPGSEAS